MNAARIPVEFNEHTPQLRVALRQVTPTMSWPPAVLGMNLNRATGIFRKAAGSNSQLVKALGESAIFGDYQRAFEAATGLPLTLRAVEGWQLAHHGSRRQNAFCAMISKESRSCAGCLRMQQRVCEGVNGVPCTLRCTFGLNESAVGVKIGKEIIAYLQTGQVFFKAPKPQQTNRVLDLLKESGLNVDRQQAARHYNQTPVIEPDAYQATIRLLQFFADQLGALANRIQLQQKDSEPEQITRARQYIEANSQEEISLADVAKHTRMSTCYFCKIFKKVTGVNFAQYVSGVRVEKAKNLLLNPNYRISEVAYEVGFQSLTHFNRVFRKIAGQSPTEYREQLSTN
jgi:AraC-like DNA-binding protein